MRKALVEAGKVVQVVEPEAVFDVHEALYWIDCPDEAIPGWVVDDGQVLEPELPSLDQVKAEQRAAIEAARDAAELDGFTYLDKPIDTDRDSVLRILTAATAAQAAIAAGQGASFSLDWTCADDSTLTMTAAEVAAMPLALALQKNALHQAARAKKAAIAEAATRSAVRAVTW